jgi:hypothetical protein
MVKIEIKLKICVSTVRINDWFDISLKKLK